MIFATHMITYLCFPSIVVLSKLKFSQNTVDLADAAVIGLINVGVFYIGSSIGLFLAIYLHRTKVISNVACFSLIVV